jgi:hypothetical protein
MSAAATATALVPYRLVAAMAIAHALVTLLLWSAVLIADLQVVSARIWLALVWLWLVWPVVLAFHRDRSLKRVAVPSLIGLALLAPCIPVAFAFTAWTIGGFAP